MLVRLAAASLNHLDVWVRMGLPSVPKPRILGADGAGVVEALGAGVDGFAVGDRVVLNPGLEHGHTISVLGEHSDGTHCELIAVPASQVFLLDDALTFEQAAAFPLVYETAYRLLVTEGGLQEGEWVLIWGIGGGVATAAFEICRALGARTIVTSGSDAKLEQARAWGADVAVNHHTGDVVQTVKEVTRTGVDVVVETVGEATWARSLGAVAAGGRIGVCGATSGPNPPAALHRFWWKQLTVYGSSMGSRDDFLGAYDLVRSGRARVHVDRVFPLAETRAAHERLEAGEQLGKIVLSIPLRQAGNAGREAEASPMRDPVSRGLAFAALVVAALGFTGVGEAVRNAVLPAGSVGTAQLRANAVTSEKIRSGAVTARTSGTGRSAHATSRPGTIPPGLAFVDPAGDEGSDDPR